MTAVNSVNSWLRSFKQKEKGVVFCIGKQKDFLFIAFRVYRKENEELDDLLETMKNKNRYTKFFF